MNGEIVMIIGGVLLIVVSIVQAFLPVERNSFRIGCAERHIELLKEEIEHIKNELKSKGKL